RDFREAPTSRRSGSRVRRFRVRPGRRFPVRRVPEGRRTGNGGGCTEVTSYRGVEPIPPPGTPDRCTRIGDLLERIPGRQGEGSGPRRRTRSEEHTSELQSRENLV